MMASILIYVFQRAKNVWSSLLRVLMTNASACSAGTRRQRRFRPAMNAAPVISVGTRWSCPSPKPSCRSISSLAAQVQIASASITPSDLYHQLPPRSSKHFHPNLHPRLSKHFHPNSHPRLSLSSFTPGRALYPRPHTPQKAIMRDYQRAFHTTRSHHHR